MVLNDPGESSKHWHMSLWETQKRGHRGEGEMQMKEETEVMLPQAREWRSHHNLEAARTGLSPRTPESMRPGCHLDFGLLASKTAKASVFCCFKPRSVWLFVIAALENWYTLEGTLVELFQYGLSLAAFMVSTWLGRQEVTCHLLLPNFQSFPLFPCSVVLGDSR